MSGIRQQKHSRRQSDVPPDEPLSQRHRRATSLIIELLPDEAMETIDRLVHDEETNFGVDAIGKKIPTLQSMAIQPVVLTGCLVHLFLFARGVAGAQGQLPINVSREGLKEYLEFLCSKDSSRVVSASVIEALFLRRIGHKSLKDAWKMIARWFTYQNAQPRNEGWFIDDLVFFSLAGREDGNLLDMHTRLVIRQALKWIGRPSSLYTSTTLVLLALAHVDPQSSNLMPD
ncbi:hypothetical protein R1flu_006829 [Riccia fluitans]|uniref:Uncharacterized protein n=1 Tax=Riccia fluitans TaxID=41844 RepID=A0ABD1YXZ1_9MARC